MVLMVLAALLKFSDLAAFRISLGTWRTIPVWAEGALATTVPATELALGTAWLALPRWGRSARMAMIVLLVAWTGAFILETIFWGPPHCGCFGRLRDWYVLRQGAPWVIARNTLLLGGLVFGTDLYSVSQTPTVSRRSRGGAAVRSFTLIETVLVIALIGLLITLAIPSLTAARSQVKSVQALADLHTHAQMTAVYGTDYRDSFPCILNPAFTHTVVVLPGSGRRVAMPYFQQRFCWWIGVFDPYYNGDAFSPSFFEPNRHGSGRREPYYYSVSGLARPEYWNETSRTQTGQVSSMRLTDVLYPTRKGVFVAWGGTGSGGRRGRLATLSFEAAWCDGGARSTSADRLIQSVVDGEGPWGWPYSSDQIGDPITHTRDGVRGMDVR
jgi:type II secretory pathway pseudopilin PulG